MGGLAGGWAGWRVGGVGGLAGGWVGGRQLRWEGRWTAGVAWLEREVEKEKKRRSLQAITALSLLSAHCLQVHSPHYRGVTIVVFYWFFLYQGQGGDNMSLFVSISGSVMWL